MPRDPLVYIEDIQEAIRKIKTYTQGYDQKAFLKDTKTIDAVIRNLEIIGEAIKKVPENIRQKYNHVEWQKIAGLRDILIHEYFGVDSEIIWDIIQSKLTDLETTIQTIIKENEV